MPARKKQPSDAPPKPTKPTKSRTKKPATDAVTKTPTRRAVKVPAGGGGGEGKPDLVIVESPSKAKTINKYLGSAYKVLASVGHIRDLPKKKKRGEKIAGIDIDKGWIATYEVLEERNKKQTVEELKKAVKGANLVYLATDPDREGEAIAWHLSEVLELDDARTFRITFNEITRQAVQNALAQPGKIDMDRVRAQEARRILDRVVGFPLSGLLNRKVKPHSSAGRVQSVALKVVVDREREIEQFIAEEYWKITALLAPEGTVKFAVKPFTVVLAKSKKEAAEARQAKKDAAEEEDLGETPEEPEAKNPEGTFEAELVEWNGSKFELGVAAAGNETSATTIATLLDSAAYSVAKIEQKDRQEKPKPPFTTSTLQQQGSLRLRFGASRTMARAQQLYQGVDLGAEGPVALITYMRTDSTRISNEALTAVRAYIQERYGDKYLPEKPNIYVSGKSAQEAHEAIRPTDLSYTPERVARELGQNVDHRQDVIRLYTMIYNQFVASQMPPALFAVTTVEVLAKPQTAKETGLFRASGRIMKFDGYRRVLPPVGKQEDATLPAMSEQQKIDKLDLRASQHFTQPPPRFNEASLIKVLEKEGIGRPSTYATIMSKITDEERGYIEVIDRRFHATEIGKIVTDLLVQFFPKVMDLKFTSHFEDELDEIERAKIKYESVLDEFWGPFSEALGKAETDMRSGKETGENCPKCGKPLLEKFSRKTNKSFIGCTDYKECKYIKPREGEPERAAPVETEHKCPSCGKPMMQLSGDSGPFLRCSGHPKCQTKMNFGEDGQLVISAQATDHKCPKCSKPMILREWQGRKFLGCSGYPKCRSTMEVDEKGDPIQPADLGINCEKCGSPMVIRKGFRGAFLGCTGYPKCRGTKQLSDELKEQLKDKLPAPAPKKELPKVEITETCPECGGAMRLQLNKRRGNYFLGCASYPKCKGTRQPTPEILEQLPAPTAG